MSNSAAKSAFGFGEGDRVRVRVREHGTSGQIVAKFEATCLGVHDRPGMSSPYARFDLPWGTMETTRLRDTEAEFEVLGDD